MDNDYELYNGSIFFNKELFAMELLIPDSPIRFLITKKDKSKIPPEIIKYNNKVEINFDEASIIDLKQNYLDYFTKLKNKFKDKMWGKISIRVICYATHFTVLDFNSKNQVLVF